MQASETEKTEVSMLDFNKATCNDNNPKHLYNIYTIFGTNVEDVGPTLYKCYKNVLCLPGLVPKLLLYGDLLNLRYISI